MQSIRDYEMVVRPDDNGTFVAYLPAIPGCHALGKTPEEAQAELQNVFEMIAEEHREEGGAMPADIDDLARRKRMEKLFERAAAGEFRFDNVDLDSLRHESPAEGYRGSLKGVRVSKLREKKDRS